jgi:hypothetical protein
MGYAKDNNTGAHYSLTKCYTYTSRKQMARKLEHYTKYDI